MTQNPKKKQIRLESAQPRRKEKESDSPPQHLNEIVSQNYDQMKKIFPNKEKQVLDEPNVSFPPRL